MKKLAFVITSIIFIFTQVQSQNPYAALGIEEQVLHYDDTHKEVFENDTIKAIGYAVFDRKNGLIALYDLSDTLIACDKIDPSKVARFLSVDPITRSYPELTPYQFASNTPIQAIDLDGLEAFIVHGTDEMKYGDRFTPDADKELLRISGNSKIDRTFRWNSVLYNNAFMRNISAKQLVKHIYEKRNEMIKNKEITEDEGISLIGYSHGGNVSIQAARKLGKMGIKVNLITVSTPAYNTDWKDALGGQLDSEDPRGALKGINAHHHIVHEKDDVVDLAGGTEKYTNPSTKNFVITNQQIPFSNGIDAHVNLPNSEKLDEVLMNIPAMSKSPKPTFPTPSGNRN